MAKDPNGKPPELNLTVIESRKEFIQNIIFFYSIIISLAVTNLIIEFYKLLGDEPTQVFPGSIESWFVAFVSLTMMFRFYFGNIAHLRADEDFNLFEIVLDSITIILQAILLSYSTFHISQPAMFFPIMIIIFLIDFVWFFIRIIYNNFSKKKSDVDNRIGQSQLIALGTILIYCLATKNWNVTVPIEHDLKTVFWLFCANTVLDVAVNAPRYVGYKWKLVVNNG